MISNERPSPFGRKPYFNPERPVPPADVLLSRELQIERKTFIVALKENPRGRFLSIIENTGRNHQMIIIPAAGLEEFQKVFGEMAKSASETPLMGGEEFPDGNR